MLDSKTKGKGNGQVAKRGKGRDCVKCLVLGVRMPFLVLCVYDAFGV